jgi:hypothetical protein
MVIDSVGYWMPYRVAPIKQPFKGYENVRNSKTKMLTKIILLKISKD